MDTLTGNVQRIPHGLTNKSWIVERSDGALVIRAPFEHSDQLKIDRNNEAIILNIVSKEGIGAPVLFCAPKESLLITQYIEGPVWQYADAHKKTNIIKICSLLKKLHALGPHQNIQTTYYSEVLKYYWNLLKVQYDQTLLQLAEKLDQTREAALCHHDVNHFNIIDDGKKLWLIDWEYAALGDPYFDLASLACYHHYSQKEIKTLLQSYFRILTPEMEKRFEEACQIFKAIERLWLEIRGG